MKYENDEMDIPCDTMSCEMTKCLWWVISTVLIMLNQTNNRENQVAKYQRNY